ncbi:SDR family oxidoreductase [Desertibaculum subflavum]|uniref:SDR family oxidoreductase n=1 Tax=Desertibaculum subflavum TaxID=2268458 RepID=UPI000E675116
MPYDSVFRPDLFRDRVIVVTGGGSGIGRCIAHELASLGARVALVGRTREKLEAVMAELGGDAARVFIHACDLRQEAPVVAMVEAVLAWAGRIDGLVNNAGGQFPAQLRDISLNGWNAVVANNLTATFLVSREIYRRCMETHGGNIVSIGADWELGMPGMGHSGAARAGQETFTRTAAVEWAHAGVRVNHVVPGFIASSGLDRYPASAHDVLRNVTRRVPLKRHGTESEIAAAVVFLLSDAAAYVTGATIRVDGGLHNNARSSFYEVPDHDRSRPFNGFPLYRRPAVLQADD